MKVYWSPISFDSILSNTYQDWSLLYYEPQNLFTELHSKQNELTSGSNFFSCPSFSNLLKNIFILKNPISSHFKFVDNNIITQSDNYIHSYIDKGKSIIDNTLFTYKLNWIFFTEEESLDLSLTSPYFSNAKHLQYGAVTPGKIDIGKYFRHITLEYNLWEDIDEFKIEKEEPLAYVNFNTNKKVELVRFVMTDKLLRYASSVANFTDIEPKIPLYKRYERFKRTSMKSLVMKEILDNVVDKSY